MESMARRLLVALAMLAALARPVFAAECPVAGADATSEAIEQASSCAKAAEIYGLCTWGSSMDIQFADVAIRKCEADFLAELTPQQRRTIAARRAAAVNMRASPERSTDPSKPRAASSWRRPTGHAWRKPAPAKRSDNVISRPTSARAPD
jgi:hypothetical protein